MPTNFRMILLRGLRADTPHPVCFYVLLREARLAAILLMPTDTVGSNVL